MAVVQELIRTEDNGTISFGDYELSQKSKLSDYQYQGDMYKVKTYKEITKLERNGMFVYESVPGTSVFHLQQDGTTMSFEVQGFEDSQITVELEAETEYQVFIDGASTGTMTTNLGGKLSFSVELDASTKAEVKIVKCYKIKKLYISARNADTNQPNGWGSVLHARRGTHLWRKRFLPKNLPQEVLKLHKRKRSL